MLAQPVKLLHSKPLVFVHVRILSNIYRYWHDKWHQKLTDITKFWHWIYWMTAQPHFSSKQMLDNSAVLPPSHMVPRNTINPRGLFLSFPHSLQKSWHEDKTPLIWLEALNNRFLFFNFIHHYFSFSSMFPSDLSYYLTPSFNHQDFDFVSLN